MAGLSTEQMFMLFEAARSLPQDRRADFLIHIFRRLPRSEATTQDLSAAIGLALEEFHGAAI